MSDVHNLASSTCLVWPIATPRTLAHWRLRRHTTRVPRGARTDDAYGVTESGLGHTPPTGDDAGAAHCSQNCWSVLHTAQSALQGPAGSYTKLVDASALVPVLVTARPSVAAPWSLTYCTTIWWSPGASVVVARMVRAPWTPAGRA